MIITADCKEDIIIKMPSLGVSVAVNAEALKALARRAHNKKGQRAIDGPLKVTVSGARPDEFQDRFEVHTLIVGENKRKSESKQQGLTRSQADSLFTERRDSGEYTKIILRGPSDPTDKKKVDLAVWKKEEAEVSATT